VTTDATRRRIALGLLLAYVAFLAVAGLNPRDLSRGNEVTWLPDGPGLRFDGHGLAYTGTPGTRAAGGSPAGFTMLLDLRLTETRGGRGFEHVVTIFGGVTDSQLLIGQWKRSLIVTSGTDYDYRQRRPRLSANLEHGDGQWHLIAVTSGPAGSRLFLDGQEAAAMAERLTLPAEDGNFQLLVGNSVHGNQGWWGAIRAIALLPRVLDPAEIAALTGGSGGTFPVARLQGEHPELLFLFGEGRGSRSADLGARALALHFPPDRVILVPEFFQPGFREARWLDVAVNLLGFVPFGFLGVLALRGAAQRRDPQVVQTTGSGADGRARSLVVVVGAGVLLSACIEIAQAWMPMRSSSLLDLLLNSTGTLVGALLSLLAERLLKSDAQPES